MTTLNMIEMTKINPVLIIIAIAVTVIGFGLIVLFMKNENRFSTFFMIFGTICFGIGVSLLIVSGNEEMKVGTGKYRIEATFTDDMPLNSVYEQYEIIDKRGDIYLLEPRVFDFNKEIEK